MEGSSSKQPPPATTNGTVVAAVADTESNDIAIENATPNQSVSVAVPRRQRTFSNMILILIWFWLRLVAVIQSQ
jgi:hypothetical protein